jgi:transmembrane sensor
MNRLRASSAEDERAEASPVVLPEIAAEAAVWVARLHGPNRSSRMERECRAWQARSAAHREAFERCTETWVDVPRVTLADAYASAVSGQAASGAARSAWRPGGPRWGFALAVAAMVLGGAVVFQQWRGSGAYSTGVGEQQLVVLDDGTRMSLNTSTRVRVDLGSAQRTVNIQEGEAIFEVAKDARRPFVVRVADSEVVALGTVFSVRLTPSSVRASNSLAVTLIEGQVTVRSAHDGLAGGVAPARPVLMQAGERVRLVKEAGASAEGAVVKVDRPRIEQVVAWKRSEAVFDNVSLAEAVAEMNRYSRTQIELFGDAALDGRRVSGVFRTGDNTAFARAVAALHGLRVHERPDRLELAPG